MWAYVVSGVVCFLSVLDDRVLGGVWVIVGNALIGFFAAVILILVLALPPLIGPPGDLHRVTAGMFTISYSCAVIVPIVSGGLWDLSGWPAVAFIPIVICTLAVVGLAPTVVLRENRAAS